MHLTRAQRVRLGAFMVVGTLVFASGVLALTGMSVWEKRSVYRVRFVNNVSGLEKSAAVKYQGLRVGRVDDMVIAADDPHAIEVTLSLDSRTTLYEGTKAILDASGLTGLKSINLTPGDPRKPALQSGALLPAEGALMDRLSGRAEEITLKLEHIANQVAHWTRDENRERVEVLVDELAELSKSLRLFLDTNREPLEKTLSSVTVAADSFHDVAGASAAGVRAVQADVSATLAEARTTIQALRRPIEGLEAGDLTKTVRATTNAMNKLEARLSSNEVGQAITDLQRALSHLGTLLEDVDLAVRSGREDFTATLSYMRQAAEDVREFSRIIAQDPAAIVRGRD